MIPNISNLVCLSAVFIVSSLSVALAQFCATFAWYPAWPEFLRSMLITLWISGFLYLICGFLLNSLRALRTVFVLLLPITFVISILNIIHIVIYKIPVNFFTIRSVFQTTATEAVNAFDSLISPTLILVVVVYTCVYLYVSVQCTKKLQETKPLPATVRWLSGVFGLALLVGLGWYAYAAKGLPLEKNPLLRSHFFVRSLIEYNLALKAHDAIREQALRAKLPVDFGNPHFVDDAEQRTYVIVLGESASRNHLSLYGYPRPTASPLEEIRDELFIWGNVVSMYGITSPSLNEAFIFKNMPAMEGIPSLVALHREAGFKTYWLTNSLANNPLTGASWFDIAADVHVKTNKATRFVLPTPFDDVLLPELEKALADPHPHKFIVLNLAGSHFAYKYRYPEEASLFADDDTTNLYRANALRSDDIRLINEYDNTIAYTSNVIRNIIQRLKQQQESVYMLYLSDHGQQLMEVEGSFTGQNAVGETKYMYNVPFFIWASDKYKQVNKTFIEALPTTLNRFMKLDDSFCHSIAELSRIDFDHYDSTKSLFSKKYTEQNAILGDGVDYSTLPE